MQSGETGLKRAEQIQAGKVSAMGRSLRAAVAGALFGVVVVCALSGCPQPNPTDRSADSTSGTHGNEIHSESVGQVATDPMESAEPADSDAVAVSDQPATGPSAGEPLKKPMASAKAGEGKIANGPPEGPKAATPQNPLRPAQPIPTPETATGSDATLFEGWDRPRAVIAITGEQHGYIEPCGCTGLANQRGGLARRFTFLQSLRDRGWPVIAVDTGDQIRRYGVQAEIKFQSTISGLRQMDYQAVAMGPDDLRLSATMLAGLAVPTDNEAPLFFSGSAHLFGDPTFLPGFRVLKAGGLTFGVTSVIGASRAVELNSDDVQVAKPHEAAAAAAAKLKESDCDWLILIVQGSLDDARSLARRHQEYDIVICSGEPGEPTRQPQPIDGSRAKLVLVGYKGMYVGVLGFDGDRTTPLRYQRVPLDARFADAPPMLQLLADYQNTLKLKGLEGLGVRAVPHPSGRKFVGSETCADCHEEAYEIWKNGVDGKGGPHAHATESLVHPGERSEIPRHYDPECLSCHVTGWNPQEYFPYESGYLDLANSKHLTGNGCENCHGPAAAHVAAENGDIDVDDAKLEQLRMELHRTLEGAEQQCMKCHDLDNSPDFHVPGAFEKYWAKIRH